MKFEFTEKELSYLVDKYKYKTLVGFSKTLYNKNKIISELIDKKYCYIKDDLIELNNDVRLLLNEWQSVRYTMSRPDLVTKKHLFCVLSNGKSIIFIDNDASKIVINLTDYTVEIMDKTIKNTIEANEIQTSEQYIFELSLDDYYNLLTKPKTCIVHLSQKNGISSEELQNIVNLEEQDKYVLLLTEDLLVNIGTLNKVFYCDDAIYMIKHITPADESKQRVVVVKGSTQFIVDSIYNIGGKN